MAEAIVSIVLEELGSVVLEKLFSIATGKVEEQLGLVVGVKKELRKMSNKLRAIQAVLADAEKREVTEESVKVWVDMLKDVSYEMDDILDEWQTAILKSEIEGGKSQTAILKSEIDGGKYISKLKQKVCSFIRSTCFCYREVGLRHGIASKIVELNEKLDEIAELKTRYSFESKIDTQQVERPVTISFINMPEVQGRDVEKNAIRKVLLSDSSDKPNPQIISLAGMGGIGKTTLAKLLYNDSLVETHFSKRIWVCVSDPFEESRIAKAILESLLGSASNLVELQTLAHKIKELIGGKKFLLVLDDVWNEVRGKWELLKGCLQCGSPGSKILVTTRKENVARIMDCNDSDVFKIGLLSKDQCWSLFSQIALSERSNIDHDNLEDLGRKIVDKCKGLPLAVKTLACLLRSKKSREEWENVLVSEVWELENLEQDLFAPLLLSYYDLPSALRQCFLYCVVFPKDCEIEKHKLIRLWMAQGYLRTTKNKNMESIGEKYFNILVSRSFFQDFKENEYFDNKITFKMHDIIHDFTQFVSKFDCINLDVYDPNSLESNLNAYQQETRHLGLKLKSNSYQCLYSLKKLRSLLFLNVLDVPILSNLFNQLTCLRLLDLNNCDVLEIPSIINRLKHLRQLDLSSNRKLKLLPESICELYNLQSLDVSECDTLEKLPGGLGKLINLRHLMIWRVYNPLVLPKGVGKLSCLRTLDMINVGHDHNSEEAFSILDLKNLNHLQGSLDVTELGNVENCMSIKTKQARLIKDKKNITGFGAWFNDENNEEWRKLGDEELLEALEPPSSLQCLRIGGYLGSSTILTSWISFLTNLKYFSLSRCTNIEYLPPLGRLPSLERLELFYMKGVKRVGIEFLGIEGSSSVQTSSATSSFVAFPKLTTLWFYHMEEWEDFEFDGNKIMESSRNGDEDTNIIIMPSLQYLVISYCPKLKVIPHNILQNTTLKELRIGESPFLKERYQRNEGKDLTHRVS